MNFIILTLLSFSLFASAQHHRPGHKNDRYLDPECNADEWNKGFEESERDTVVHKKSIIGHLPVKKGDVIADVGAGTGSFESDLSKVVGKTGKIFAVDIAPAFIPFMKKRFEKEKLTNVEVVLGKIDQTTLKENSVDVILVVDTYHHFDHHEKMLQDFKKILKDQGHLVIVDFKREKGARKWILDHVEKTMEQYIDEVASNGFTFIKVEPIKFKESFQLTFKKK
jgi:ubiquinone/menaquinone biosynthesis C-methylase UbiE